jgi:hypothetical protein
MPTTTDQTMADAKNANVREGIIRITVSGQH